MPAGVGMAGVEAEPDHLGALGRSRSRPTRPAIRSSVPRHRLVAAGGVLDQHRELEVGRLDRLAPVVEAGGRVVALVDVAAVHDQPLRADRRGGVHVLLEQLAGRDPDPVVRRRHVDDVRRVDVEVDPGRLGVGPQAVRAAGVPDLGALVALRVAEEELHQRRLARPRPRRPGRSGRRGRRCASRLVHAQLDPTHARPPRRLAAGTDAALLAWRRSVDDARLPDRCPVAIDGTTGGVPAGHVDDAQPSCHGSSVAAESRGGGDCFACL